MTKPEWENSFNKALGKVWEDYKEGIFLREENLQASLYHHLRTAIEADKKLRYRYTVLTEFKYSWKQRPSHSQGYDFDLAILKNWNHNKNAEFGTDASARDSRYKCTVGLIEIKMAKTFVWGNASLNKNQWVESRYWKKDLEKFRKLWGHPSRFQAKLERAYLCLFDEARPPESNDRFDYKDASNGKIKIISCTKEESWRPWPWK
jgi:hypothetical protein